MARHRGSLMGQLALAGSALAVLIFTTTQVRPVYVGRTPVVQRLIGESWRDSTVDSAPWATQPTAVALASDQFTRDQRAFADDLRRTGRITPERADSLATFAVREAYMNKVPPALVFGVMMIENPSMRSNARSNVGAVGLMQIYPKVWRELGKKFGTNLKNDETNLRYGVFILSHFLDRANDTLSAESTLRYGLLRYNGCVRGSNTKNCHRYPDIVRTRIESMALAQCGAKGYDGCVAAPMRLSMRDDLANDTTTLALNTR